MYTFIFIFSGICGFDFMWIGFTVLRNLIGDSHVLDCFNCGLWTWTQHTFFPCLFCLLPLFTSSLLSPIFRFSPCPISTFPILHLLRKSSFPSCSLPPSFSLSSIFLSLRAKDMKNRLAFLRRRNESPGSNPASKLDKSMKSVK